MERVKNIKILWIDGWNMCCQWVRKPSHGGIVISRASRLKNDAQSLFWTKQAEKLN